MEWKKAFPAVDIKYQLERMVVWSNANPKRRKTRRGIERFIGNWLANDQDKGGTYYSGNKKDSSIQNKKSESKQDPELEEELVGEDEIWWKYGPNGWED